MLTIKDVLIMPMTNEAPYKGDIVCVDGVIMNIGVVDNDIGETIEGSGLVALPGLIDCHSHIGGMDYSTDRPADDSNEMTSNTTPEMQILYGTNPKARDFEFAYRSGITTLGLTPGSGNVICGQVMASKTYGSNIFDMCIKNPVGLKLAMGGNPIRTYGERKQRPSTRMSVPQVFRELFSGAKTYLEKRELALSKGEPFNLDDKYDAVVPVLRKEIPLRIHCTQHDIMTAIEIALEYDMEFCLEHAWGATDYIEEIVGSGASVVYGPIGSRLGHGEFQKIDIGAVSILDKRGVLIALTTDAPILSIDALIHHAGEVVRSGVDVVRALRMITHNAAKVLRVDDRVGTLEVGKDADIVLFDGMPALDAGANVKYTILNGQIIYKA